MDYYQKITIERNIIIDSKYINKNLNENILTLLKNDIEEKCIGEGYIQKDSTEIIQRSIGTIVTNSFKANVSYHVMVNVNVCNPPKNSILKTKVIGMNKSGIFCISEPLNILVIKNLMKENEFDNINIGDMINIRVKDKKFNLYDKVIKIIAEIVEDDSPVDKRKINKSNILYHKSNNKITISDNYDDSDNESIFSEAEENEIQSLSSEDDSYIGNDHDILEEDTIKEQKHEEIINKTLIDNTDEENDEEENDEEEEEDDEEKEEEEDDDDDDDDDEEKEEDDDENIIEDED